MNDTPDDIDPTNEQRDLDAEGAAEGVQALTGLVLSVRWALEIIRDQGGRSPQAAVERGLLALDQLEAAATELRSISHEQH